jgi:hypothetical protein
VSDINETLLAVLKEPEIRAAVLAMGKIGEYEVFETIERFNAMMGLSPLYEQLGPKAKEHADTFRRRFHRKAA